MNLYKDLHGCLIVDVDCTLFCIPYYGHHMFDQSSCDYISWEYLFR